MNNNEHLTEIILEGPIKEAMEYYVVDITMEGPVMENMTRVSVKWAGADETFYVDHDDAEEFEEPELKIELIMEFAGNETRNAINAAENITLNGESVDMDAVKSTLNAINAMKR
jgi:hypothetical protein